MDFREVVDAQVSARTKSVLVSTTKELNEKKITATLQKKGYNITKFERNEVLQ